MWWLLAKLLSHPALVWAILKLSRPFPYFHIYDKDKSLYMGRWWVIKERNWLPFAARLHHIVRPDTDRALHDHPYDYRTIILSGGYDELDVFGATRTRRPGDTVAARAQTFHKITSVQPQTLTLFIYRARWMSNPWGFLVPDVMNGARKVPWKAYLADQLQNYPAEYHDKRSA